MKIRSAEKRGAAILYLTFAVFAMLQRTDCQVPEPWVSCSSDTIADTETESNWNISCRGDEIAILIKVDEIDLKCGNATHHGLITISKFPLKNLCRVKKDTCFIFTSPDVQGGVIVPLTTQCKDMYWTRVRKLSFLSVQYETSNNFSVDAKFSLSYTAYKTVSGRSSSPDDNGSNQSGATTSTSSTEQVLAIAFGCLCALFAFVIVCLVARLYKKDAEARRQVLDTEYRAGTKKDRDTSEREIVVNRLYEM